MTLHAHKFITDPTPRRRFPILKTLDYLLDGHEGFIAGGVFKDLFSNRSPKDVDIFFRKESDWVDATTLFEIRYDVAYETTNAVGYQVPNGPVVELIRAQFGEPLALISDFDFTISMMAYYTESSEDSGISHNVVFHQSFFEHLTNKKIMIMGPPTNPVSSFQRALKYISYGYTLPSGSQFYLLNGIHSKLDPNGSYTINNLIDDLSSGEGLGYS